MVKGDRKSSTSGWSAGESRRHLQASKGDKDTREPKLICYYCQQPGHKATVCPARKAKLTRFCYVPRKEDSTVNCMGNPQLVPVTVNGKELKALLDTGSSMSLVKRCHVTRVSFTHHTKLQCVHGEVKQYPQTEVNVSINGQTYLLTVAVVETLPANVILGRDVPVLPELVQANWEEERASFNVQLACPVVTRTQAKMGLQPLPFPLCSITTPKIINALIQLFSRVGIPEEILTDQGTNFTSRLMKLLHRQLGITAIKTSPYHPQTDGLVERFNKTLKGMLRKFVLDTGRDWDKWLPFLLFPYREVPQALTGFSPFKLLYGWQVQGPLDLLRRNWEDPCSGNKAEKGIVQYILEMRDRFENYRKLAAENLQKAQKYQKTWGPTVWYGRMGQTSYEIYHPDKGKAKQMYHINLLKEWKEPPSEKADPVLLIQKVEEDREEDHPEPKASGQTQPAEVDLGHLEAPKQAELQTLFGRYPALFRQRPGRTNLVHHKIHLTNTTPSRQRPYRVPERLVAPLKAEVRTMLEMGVIEPSSSKWSSPVVIVPKKDNTLRICIDFRQLNSQSQFDAYPMPRIDDLLEKIGGAKYVTTLDLCRGYWQVPLEKTSRPYTAFRTPLGLFQFTVLPFGLHGAPATFQRLMDQVLQGGKELLAAYLDDVVVHSKTWADHLNHLEQTLRRIQEAGLTLNVAKCVWAKAEADYLGYRLGDGELRPQVDKVEAIRNSPRPTTKKEVRSILGLVGWYRRFIPNFSTTAGPLTNLLEKAVKNPIRQTVNASAVGIGAVLTQGEEGNQRPVAFLSRKLLPRETRYSTIEKECLAIKWALESLKYYLLGREFTLETDHRALTWIHTMKDHNARVTRWYLSLQPYNFRIRHRPGKQNLTADYLFRHPASSRLAEGESDVTE
ncbi:hypothetical protein C0J50_10699 [Silurus asotus]|uniref:Reverse transcriptase n=1 Tax=Silurus asotus TaxID=30991 RepID=A0AAD5AI68_SILAS|nr:hypothetical protein C0J50_10699 [Silurus asotus]